jgi:hypothetical protein
MKVSHAALVLACILALGASGPALAQPCVQDADLRQRRRLLAADQCVSNSCVLGGGGDLDGDLVPDAELDTTITFELSKVVLRRRTTGLVDNSSLKGRGGCLVVGRNTTCVNSSSQLPNSRRASSSCRGKPTAMKASIKLKALTQTSTPPAALGPPFLGPVTINPHVQALARSGAVRSARPAAGLPRGLEPRLQGALAPRPVAKSPALG